jgi:serine/threonine-protein kinase ULK4
MRYIHSRRIIHSDLKPSNILINDKEHVWICDFGASRSVDDPTSRNETGTVHYAAPEQYDEGSVCTTKCDVFTFGLVMYEMLVGVPVFHPSESPFAVIRRLRDRDLPVLPSGHGELMKSLLVQCWKEDPTDRPSFGEIFDMFKAADFQILPEADHSRIRDFAKRIVAWEETARKSEAGRPC